MNSLIIGIIIGTICGGIFGFMLCVVLISEKVIADLKYWQEKTDNLEKENRMLKATK